jgi:hypothetical protein
VSVKSKIKEALEVLTALGMPREQLNERSALTLLSLLDLKPRESWSVADKPLVGITPMMEFFAKHYGKKYAPNSRETVRRFTVHQFEHAGLILKNPDKPRPVNSPDCVYQIEASTHELLKTFGGPDWNKNLSAFLATRKTLRERYAAERVMRTIPVTLPSGATIGLSPGGQNILIKEVIDNFCPRFTPGARVVYIGDASEKFAVWEKEDLRQLGVTIDKHGKMPDVVIHDTARDWLILVEAVTSHGPTNAKRHQEPKTLFRSASSGLVFVTAFLDRRAMSKYLADIAWETEVWVAESPSHLIHFNGERFLGPYRNAP